VRQVIAKFFFMIGDQLNVNVGMRVSEFLCKRS